MAEQVRNWFLIVSSPDGLSQDNGDINHLYFGAMFYHILLRYGIGDEYSFETCIVDASDGRTQKDSTS